METAPKITPEHLNNTVLSTEVVKHITPSGQILRWGVITTINGFAVTGKPSVAVSPENDDAVEGEKIAIENAKNSLWELEGYLLKQKIHEFNQGLRTDIGM